MHKHGNYMVNDHGAGRYMHVLQYNTHADKVNHWLCIVSTNNSAHLQHATVIIPTVHAFYRILT